MKQLPLNSMSHEHCFFKEPELKNLFFGCVISHVISV